jgi:hypothetical protein
LVALSDRLVVSTVSVTVVADRGFVGDQIFVVAAGHVGDGVGQRRVAGQRIVRRGGGHGAGGFADFDGDGLTVGQGHDTGEPVTGAPTVAV